MQDLKHFRRVTITLKSGVQMHILASEVKPDLFNGTVKIEGMEATPILCKKTIVVQAEEIAGTEIVEDPHVVWGNAINEVDIGGEPL